MSRRVFTSAVLLLLVVMMCCGGGAASSQDMPSSSQGASSEKYYVWTEKKGGETVGLLRVPGLVEMNGEVFAVAEAQLKGESDFNGIASELLTLTGQESKELVKAQVETQVLVECSPDKKNCASHSEVSAGSQSEKRVHVSRPTTVVKGSDIYMLVGKYSRTAAACGAPGSRAGVSGLLLVKGEVSDEESGSEKRIQWNENQRLTGTFSDDEHKCLTQLIGGGGSGIKTNDGTFLFPVEARKKQNEDGNTKTVSLILYSKDTNTNWKLSNWMSDGGCGDPSVVEWKDKLMMMTACDDGRRRVYESADKGDSWTEALGTLSRVWGNKQKGNVKGVGSGFITARIENRDVMLVTLPVYAKKEEKESVEKGELHLWLTDNTHIVDIGPVSVEGDDVAASSLLYKSGDNNELIALYEKEGDGDTPSLGMVSVRLTEQLEKVKEVLKTWKKVDERVSQLCPSTAAKVALPQNVCSAGKITAGLVGFLSGSFSESTWRDEYLGVNATVKGGAAKAKTSDGVTFHGAWAEWPVGAQGENQLYHFANYNFTLVATVSIDGVPKGDTPIPLMGVNMKGEQGKFFGLSYEKERKWMLLCGDGTTNSGELSSTGEPGTKRHVVILLRNGTQGSVYVDGQRVGDASCELGEAESKGISHFHIGGDGDKTREQEGVPVTVTNVLLYNRPLSSAEMTAHNTIKLSISQTAKEGETDEGTALDGGAHGDASNHCGSGLLPSLLLLLGLWWFASL
ncbi:amastigote surface protein 4 [Trypanosoma cruzi]|nr:amastigote surface protein 4 [Trypanosoma cruzi]